MDVFRTMSTAQACYIVLTLVHCNPSVAVYANNIDCQAFQAPRTAMWNNGIHKTTDGIIRVVNLIHNKPSNSGAIAAHPVV